VMRSAVDLGVNGIIGECGGAAMCGTCHVLVDEQWLDRLPPMSQNEDELLDCTATPREWGSRLACQLRMTAELDGLALQLPERQR
jgi:2Fe-2S ferredoxin